MVMVLPSRVCLSRVPAMSLDAWQDRASNANRQAPSAAASSTSTGQPPTHTDFVQNHNTYSSIMYSRYILLIDYIALLFHYLTS